jgi:hypothetical protein
MIRKIVGFAVVALVALLVFKIALGLLGVLIGLAVSLLVLAAMATGSTRAASRQSTGGRPGPRPDQRDAHADPVADRIREGACHAPSATQGPVLPELLDAAGESKRLRHRRRRISGQRSLPPLLCGRRFTEPQITMPAMIDRCVAIMTQQRIMAEPDARAC